jgi:hypothetical protein
MTAEHERRGALEAIDRILNRGGEADDVLRDVLQVLFQLYEHVAIGFVEEDGIVDGPAVGAADEEAAPSVYPITFQGSKVAELRVAHPGPDDEAFLTRVATIVSPYALVGWDTRGEAWDP